MGGGGGSGASVMCRNIGLSDIEIYGSYLNRKEII
jgi:hypothetical protein